MAVVNPNNSSSILNAGSLSLQWYYGTQSSFESDLQNIMPDGITDQATIDVINGFFANNSPLGNIYNYCSVPSVRNESNKTDTIWAGVQEGSNDLQISVAKILNENHSRLVRTAVNQIEAAKLADPTLTTQQAYDDLPKSLTGGLKIT